MRSTGRAVRAWTLSSAPCKQAHFAGTGSVKRGEVWWAELDAPGGSEPAGRRQVLVVQADSFNASRIDTVLVAVITTNLRMAEAPGNVRIPRRTAGMVTESVVNVSQVATIDKDVLVKRAGHVPTSLMAEIDAGLRLVLEL
jgi:mRNA interferase MazF